METLNAVLALGSNHPVVATAFSATAIVAIVAAYKLAALAADTLLALVGRPSVVRTVKRGRVNRRTDAPTTDDQKTHQARAALAHLGYHKAEVEPALAAADLSAPLPEVVRGVIRRISASSQRAVS